MLPLLLRIPLLIDPLDDRSKSYSSWYSDRISLMTISVSNFSGNNHKVKYIDNTITIDVRFGFAESIGNDNQIQNIDNTITIDIVYIRRFQSVFIATIIILKVSSENRPDWTVVPHSEEKGIIEKMDTLTDNHT